MAASDRVRPVCETQADALLALLIPFRRLALAVSGGPDSTALLLLVAAWRARRTDAPEIHVLTVDHGLRPEAAEEARAVAALSERLGFPCRILTSTAPKPAVNRQAAARDLRQGLLLAACAELGAEALVLAHHLDDQAETFLLRLARGSGVYGLAAMPARGLWQDDAGTCVAVLRPLLAVAKANLIATCEAAGETFAEDPSNGDPAYARTRLRALMPALAREGLDAETLGATAARLASAAAVVDAQVDAVLASAVVFIRPAPARVSVAALARLPRETLLRLLARLLADVGGEAYPPRLVRLEGLVERLAENDRVQATLSGVVARRRDGEIVFWREPGRTGLAPADLNGPGRLSSTVASCWRQSAAVIFVSCRWAGFRTTGSTARRLETGRRRPLPAPLCCWGPAMRPIVPVLPGTRLRASGSPRSHDGKACGARNLGRIPSAGRNLRKMRPVSCESPSSPWQSGRADLSWL